MQLNESYKVKVTPEQSREIHTLILKNGGEVGYDTPADYSEEYLAIEIEHGTPVIYYSDYELWVALRKHKEITAPELIALLSQDNKETKMPNLSDFLKCEKVRCVQADDDSYLTHGKEYNNLGIYILLEDDKDNKDYIYHKVLEPVIETEKPASEPLAEKPKFEVRDRVYFPAVSSKVISLPALQDGRFGVISDCGSEVFILPSGAYHNGNVAPYIVKATPENYEMLCKLYPHIEFEAPAKELTGSDLCRAMLDKGWKYVPCYLSDISENRAFGTKEVGLVVQWNKRNFIADGLNATYAVPFDPKTGNVLTSEVLDD